MNLTIDGQNYRLIRQREYMPVAIYEGADTFLRIGRPDLIEKELALHKMLLAHNFPVAQILKEGSHEEQAYYIEQSLGKEHLGEMFWQDYENTGLVSDQKFDILLELSTKFAEAQLSTVQPDKSREDFNKGVHFHLMAEELPHLESALQQAFVKLKDRLVDVPNVLTHGDFNPFNFCTKGVIDFGNVFYGPAGYDLVSVIYHTYFFPKDRSYEMYRMHQFTEQQTEKFFAVMDKMYKANGLEPVSKFIPDFALCRLTFAAARMEKYPKIQRWRCQKLEQVLPLYLNGDPIMEAITEDK